MANDDLFEEADVAEIPEEAAPLEEAAPAEAPQPAAPQQPRTQKPRSNVYTMMLILSLAAIVTSCVVLYLYLDQYGDYPWWEPPTTIITEVGR